MIVVGMKNCEKCRQLKEKLEAEGTDFEYMDFREIPLGAQRKISRQFRNDEGAIDFPVVIEDREEYRL